MDFPIGPIHLVYLGEIGKLLHILVQSKDSMKVRIFKKIISEISGILEAIAKLISVEFSRKTRSLEKVSRLKAMESRLKLLFFYLLS
jgi:ArsR family metal-binding transcriptional regulator